MRSRTRFLVRLFASCFAFLLAGKARAQFPQGVKSGISPEPSQALVTLAIPAIVGVNVVHNFVLDFNSGTKCWGNTGATSFPPATSGNTNYTFAVSTASISSGTNVACPGSGAQSDEAMIQVLSTFATTSHLTAQISDGGVGGQATAFTTLIPDVFSQNRLKLLLNPGDPCGGGSTAAFPFSLQVAAASEVTAIPKTGWSNCQQTLQLTLGFNTIVGSGTATGTLSFTMINP